MLCPVVFGIVFLFADQCRARPAEIPSSSLNLPIDETPIDVEKVDVRVSDTPKDRTMLEYTFKEPKIHDYIQNTLAQIVQPTPIVDNLQEKDKYGNDGDKFYTLGEYVVKGTEGATRIASIIVGVPARIFRAASTKTTDVLNRVGGALIGL